MLKGLDGGATKANGGASAPVGPSVATPLLIINLKMLAKNQIFQSEKVHHRIRSPTLTVMWILFCTILPKALAQVNLMEVLHHRLHQLVAHHN